MQSKTGTGRKGGHPQVKRVILNLLIKPLEETRQHGSIRTNCAKSGLERYLPSRNKVGTMSVGDCPPIDCGVTHRQTGIYSKYSLQAHSWDTEKVCL